MAKRDLHSGERIGDIGGKDFLGRIYPFALARSHQAIPMGIVPGGMVLEPISQGALFTATNFQPDTNTFISQLRCQQDALPESEEDSSGAAHPLVIQPVMKAIVIHQPEQFGLEEIPRPECSPEGLLLKVEACGLCGGDLRTLRSGHPRVKFPWTIGHEVAGTVAAVGMHYRGPYRIGTRLAVGPLAYHPQDEFCLEGRHELCADYREIGQHWPGGFAEFLAIPPNASRLERSSPSRMAWNSPWPLSANRFRPVCMPMRRAPRAWAIRWW